MVVQVVGVAASSSAGRRRCSSVAQHYKLPFLMLLLDNTGWSAVKESTLRIFPAGEAKEVDLFQANLMPDAEFSRSARRSVPMAKRSPTRTTFRRRKRWSRRCAAAAPRSCTPGNEL